jgi:hypothetical protein
MTGDQSKLLKAGTRVYFNGNNADRGIITANFASYVTINWEDGHQSFTGHRNMQRVELSVAKR